MIGPIECEAQDGIAEFIGVRRVEIHEVLAVGKVLAGERDHGIAVAPFQRSGFPSRSPIRVRGAAGRGVEAVDRAIPVRKHADRAHAQQAF